MTVILFILKIIGILLLSLIGIVFFLLALLLFVPVRYRISAEIEDKVGLLGIDRLAPLHLLRLCACIRTYMRTVHLCLVVA